MTRLATLTARLLSALCMLAVVLAWAGFAFGTESTWWIELARYLPRVNHHNRYLRAGLRNHRPDGSPATEPGVLAPEVVPPLAVAD